MTEAHPRSNLAHDLFFPILLFGSLGGMTWAVRGSSGFGASAGCIFAGVTLGTAWWFIAREPGGKQTRRYNSGWIILAMTVAFGIAGNRGWMQWPAFWDNRIYINRDSYEYIDRSYGFLWLFIAGVPWAGLGACMIAWCAEGRRNSPWLWFTRLAFGVGASYLLSGMIFESFPNIFLPLYESLQEKYVTSPRGENLWKMIRDNREAMQQMGLYLGFLFFEVVRRDWKNVTLILTVGLLNGAGWSLLQNWSWSKTLWPDAQFNFWRCWETSGGISIGIAFGVAYFLVNRRMSEREMEEIRSLQANPTKPGANWLLAYVVYAALLGWVAVEVMPAWHGFSNALTEWGVPPSPANWAFPSMCTASLTILTVAFGVAYYRRANADTQNELLFSDDSPILERWGAYLGLILGMGISIERGFKGWANIFLGNEHIWDNVGWIFIGPSMAILMLVLGSRLLRHYRPSSPDVDVFPHAYRMVWFVMIVQNVIAQLITAPHTSWPEVAFDLYYILLFFITAPIIYHYQYMKTHNFRG